ncbi:hypothetical protein H0486_00540 [Lachnospiraceae bacterium MD1]|uniref:DRTGG domain-containing protein n=1 Tax=Variimorphobacter saccharofermentans TaxID=2755051 RepID=A0A839JWK3_9FIRM|nr:hypothetical protein [Variimorphobacter saccharofermentans]MBB2181382.1 hypothetical protein [Variimorphobacter saccharofermentans]
MKVKELVMEGSFNVVNEGDDLDREISGIYCCDLLSIAMGKMPAGSAWVTVMGNVNTLAVSTLADAACIVLAEGCTLDDQAVMKAKEQGITVMATELPVFEAALMISRKLHD